MSQNNSSLVGQIDLLSLVESRIQTVDGQECIVIPKGFNPSIFVTTTKNGGRKAYLDIVVRESPGNQFGNTHFVKAQVGKTTREKLGLSKDDLVKYSPIIGNLKPLESMTSERESQNAPARGFQGF